MGVGPAGWRQTLPGRARLVAPMQGQSCCGGVLAFEGGAEDEDSVELWDGWTELERGGST